MRTLTGIKPTGEPHIGNWMGAIAPALQLASEFEALYFIADYHALTTCPPAEVLSSDTLKVGCTWLAMGLDPEKVLFYRQSRIPEVFELAWFLSCFTPKGFMNRAHVYKDRVAGNQAAGKDPDHGVNMGLYSYPVLMAADILAFQADVVPIGQDQIQHLEFTQDIAERVNAFYKKALLRIPQSRVTARAETIPGLDGRKMSKSHGNTIPIFLPEEELKKRIQKIVTNSQSPEEPKDPDQSYLFALHSLFLDEAETRALRERYRRGGMGWGEAKAALYETVNDRLQEPRRRYQRLMSNPGILYGLLAKGEATARELAAATMQSLRSAAGYLPGN